MFNELGWNHLGMDQYLGDKAKYAKSEIEKYYKENSLKLVEHIEKCEMPQSFVIKTVYVTYVA